MTQVEDAPGRDWHEWYRLYDDPLSLTSQRLAVVREWIRFAVEAVPPGPVRTVSICAGDGRDLVGALAGHPRRSDVPTIDSWFADAGFAQQFMSAAEHQYAVGVHRLVTTPQPLPQGEHLFTFIS